MRKSHTNCSEVFLGESIKLLEQSMIKLRNCLQQLDDQQVWWRPEEGINSIGNLILHSCGNLRQWAIAGLTEAPDQRDRESEFSVTGGISADQLLSLAESTVIDVSLVVKNIDGQTLGQSLEIQGFTVTVLEAILHTTTHFVGHTNQVILLTRMQLKDSYQFAWLPESSEGDLPI